MFARVSIMKSHECLNFCLYLIWYWIWNDWNEMKCIWIGSSIWNSLKPESISLLIFASIFKFKFIYSLQFWLLNRPSKEKKPQNDFKCLFLFFLAQGAAITSCPEPYGEQVSFYEDLIVLLESSKYNFILLISELLNRLMLIPTIVTNFSSVQMVHWHLKRAKMVCYSMEREVYTIIAIIIGLSIVEHENSIVSLCFFFRIT